MGIDLHAKTGIRFCSGDALQWRNQPKREWDKYTFGCYGCWVMDDDGNLDYVSEEDYTEELWNEQKKSGERNRAAASTSKNNQSVDYGTKRILSRRGTCREDAERRIRLARLRQSFLRRLAGGIRPLLRGKGGLLSATNPLPSLSASRTNSWRRQWNAATHNENNPTMAIRTNTNPRQMDLQPEMRNMLMRNGLQAHVALDGSGYRLIVQGHDSPLLVYPISERQMLALTDWGTNTANKKAYNVLTSIVGKDFYMPKNFVHARNANGRVAMGLHGYRIGIGEYGHMGATGYAPSIPWLDTTRTVGVSTYAELVGSFFFPGPSIVPERPDGRMKPGELQSGGYGFYYKGGQQEQPIVQQDVLKNLQEVITPLVSRPRSRNRHKHTRS